jgi:hypothetical protein
MSDAYTVESFGDGAQQVMVFGWDNVVSAVASMLYSPATEKDRDEAREMLEQGVDGDEGWNGKVAHLRFEDGAIVVRKAAANE